MRKSSYDKGGEGIPESTHERTKATVETVETQAITLNALLIFSFKRLPLIFYTFNAGNLTFIMP